MLLRVALSALLAALTACGGGGSSSSDPAQVAAFDFSPPTSAQLSAIAQAIRSRDLSARNVSVVYEYTSDPAYVLRIFQHTVNGVQHYGAVTTPRMYDSSKLPVVADLDGLDDNNPPMDLARKLRGLGPQVYSAIFVLPAYRGRTLQYADRSWAAGGDSCDAFDGAADDTMALLNVLQASEPRADMSRLLVRGGSRGGGVALLLGERDVRVKWVAAGSAPVDFYRADVAAGYGAFYQCQFFKGKTADQSRQAMISASALHFPMLKNVTKVYLDHGGTDDTVPLQNAVEMNKRLLADGVSVDFVTYPGAGHDLGVVQAYRDRQSAIFNAFVSP